MTPTDAVEVKLAALQITQAEEDMATSRLERRPSLCKQILHVNIVVSTDDVDKLYHHFLRIDEDGNGVIDRDELLRIPSVAGNPLASRLLELFDTDDSGDINFGEFVAGLSIFSAKSSSEKKYKCKPVGWVNL
jgi:Ca2+-binding EF-hand superfamily protein